MVVRTAWKRRSVSSLTCPVWVHCEAADVELMGVVVLVVMLVLGGGTRQEQALLTRDGPQVLGTKVGKPVVAVCVAFV